MHDNLYGSFLRSEIGSTFLSGIPGGVVQAELPLPPDLLNQFPIGICPPLKLPSVPIINKQTPELKTEIEKRPH